MTNQTIRTGFPAIDKITGGLHPGMLYVIAGRGGVGKSALAMNIAEHVAIDEGVPVAVFNQKMPSHHILRRLRRSRARVANSNTLVPTINKEEGSRNAATSVLSKMKIFVDDTTGVTINDIKTRTRRLRDDVGIKLVVLDYIQLLRIDNSRQKNATISSVDAFNNNPNGREQSEISHGCKSLAEELAIPVIVICYLPVLRSKENHPNLNDLRIWAGLENKSDVVGLLSRDKYEADGQRPSNEQDATFTIAKHRNGPTGQVLLTYLKHHTRFEERKTE